MTREKVEQTIDHAKALRLALSVVFSEHGVQQVEYLNFNDESFDDTWVDDDDNLAFYDEFNNRWVLINITRIKSINIHEKVIF